MQRNVESGASAAPAGTLDTPLQANIEVSPDLIIVPFVPGQYTDGLSVDSDTPIRNTTSVLFQVVQSETGEQLTPISFMADGQIFFNFTINFLDKDPITGDIRPQVYQVDQDLLQRGQHYDLSVPLTDFGIPEGYEIITTFFPLPAQTAIVIPPETLLAQDAQGQVVANANVIEFGLPAHNPARPFDTPIPLELVQMAIKGPNVAHDTSLMVPGAFPTTSPPYRAEPILQPVGSSEEIDEALRTEIAPLILANATVPLYVRHMVHFLARYWGDKFNNADEHPLRSFYNPQPAEWEPIIDVQRLFDLGTHEIAGEHLAIPIIQRELRLLFDDTNTTTRPSLDVLVDPQFYQVFPPFQGTVVDEKLRSFMKLAVLNLFGKPSMFRLDDMCFGFNSSGKPPKVIPRFIPNGLEGFSQFIRASDGGLQWHVVTNTEYLRQDPEDVESNLFLSTYQSVANLMAHEAGHSDIEISLTSSYSNRRENSIDTWEEYRNNFENVLKDYLKELDISERKFDLL